MTTKGNSIMPHNQAIQSLSNELVKPITSAKQAYYIIGLLGQYYVSMYELQQQRHEEFVTLAKEVYGNGVPGGIKLKVSSIETKLDALKIVIEQEQKQPDTFKRVVSWFVDKVLPTLTGMAIIYILSRL